MRKFFILLKKEIRELLTLQLIVPLLLSGLLFFSVGTILSSEQKKNAKPIEISVVDQDQTADSKLLIGILRDLKVDVTVSAETDLQQALKQGRQAKSNSLLIIPAGFEANLDSGKSSPVSSYVVISNFSLMGNSNTAAIGIYLKSASDLLSHSLITQNSNSDNASFLQQPIKVDDYVMIGDRTVATSPETVINFISNQTVFIPTILFFVIIFAAQMIATSIASEKENKTLETLLTVPISRKAIVIAKMMAAGFVALLASLINLVGFRAYMGGFSSGEVKAEGLSTVVNQLGLTWTPTNYILLGISLFVGILVALSIALILGAFAGDIKGVAGLLTPLSALITLPYFLTTFININTATPVLKYITLTIPFSHIFMTAPNLFLHNLSAVWFGILYQFIWFVVFVAIAVRIFSTEKILVMKLNFFTKK
ncbi:MAG: ABC transporter permease [Candidatus Berkelbacteria bacterium]|nr:ABC transporter permease [Candidatus Berkelbacteria bacterium]